MTGTHVSPPPPVGLSVQCLWEVCQLAPTAAPEQSLKGPEGSVIQSLLGEECAAYRTVSKCVGAPEL